MRSAMDEYCVLFDSDGTLVDSEPITCRALAESFAGLGVLLDADELFVKYRGWKFANLLQDLCGPRELVLPENFTEKFRALVAEKFETELEPIEGAAELLECLSCPVAVVSSGPSQKIHKALAVTGLAHYFGNNIYSAYDIGVWKPDPKIYSYAAAELGFTAGKSFVIDDTLIGVEAGYKAGMTTFFLNHLDEDCPFAGVFSVSTLMDVSEFLPH